MKKNLLVGILFCFLLPWIAQAQSDANFCDKLIYVDSTLIQPINANEYYYFTANTEDLPLSVYFFPDSEPEIDPVGYVDLTCESGVYNDENVRDIVELAAMYEIYFPIALPFEKGEFNGKTAYYANYDRSILDVLTILGVDYSIPVYVSCFSDVSGTIQMNNKKMLTNCSEICHRIEMRDTLYLNENSSVMYYLPVKEWAGKYMSLTWTGSTPIRAYLENNCEFDTLTCTYTYKFSERNSNGQPVQKLTNLNIKDLINHAHEDGNIYVRFSVQENAKLYIRDYVDHGYVTIEDCVDDFETNAIEFPASGINMQKTSWSMANRIQANKLENKNVRLQWKSATNKLAVAYFANFCGFEFKASDPDVLDTVHFVYNEELQCMVADIPRDRMNKITANSTDGWLFMDVYRQESGTFSWDTYEVIEPDCDTKSLLLNPNDSIVMPANNYNTSYKMVGDDWKNFANTFTWRGKRKAFVYIADTCDFPLAPYNIHVGKYFELNPNQPVEISQKDLAKLVKNYALDGNLYLRLRSDVEGALVTSQAKPQDVTVEFNVTECDSYTWHGTTYTESGTYQHLGQTTLGADSLEILHLIINYSVNSEETVVACDSYTWNGNTYTTSGDYVCNGKTISDCDSIVTLKLTINYSDTVELTPVTATDSYVWHDVEYTESGTYTYLTQTEQGCDSLEILQITINSGAGVENAIVAEGENAKLVMINQSLYIQVQGTKSTEYYDLTGRKVDIMD